jgi:hypothetical protein
MGRRLLAPWLRRGLQAGVIGGLLSSGTILAFHFGRPDPHLALPNGIDGALILLPAVIALGVFAVSGPVFIAATRGEAFLGAMAAFLVAADLLMGISVVVGESVYVHSLSRSMPLGTVAAALAVPVGIVGLAVGQITAPLGFGRSAGIRTAVTSAILAILVALVGAYRI